MPRFCAILTPDSNPENLRDEIAQLNGTTIFVDNRAALALIKNAFGRAESFRFDKLTAVGEITLDNRDEIVSLISSQVLPECSDAEILLRFYAQDGIAAFARVRGMFAVAIYDGESLLLARDAIGARTCFYARSKNAWAVASSLKSLRRWRRLDARINLSAVRSFLTFAYLPGAETLLENVFEMLPGQALRLWTNGEKEIINYYEPIESGTPEEQPAEFYVSGLRRILEQATAERLPPNPSEDVGVFLSGGIDSSLVTALARRLHASRVHTYSISFGEQLPNETAYSSLVAAHCQTTHHILSFGGKAIASHLAESVAELDCPVGDPLTVPNLLLARAAARDGLRIVLNGEGGDPCFGGPKNLPMLIEQLHHSPDKSRARTYLSSYRKCYDDLHVLLAPEVTRQLENAPALERLVEPFLESARFDSYLNRLLYTNIRTKLAHHILPKVERLTASCGILGRAPLCDKTVVDFSFQIPPQLKLRGTTEKWILKESVRDLLPATVVDRPKSGMRVPVQQWLHGPLKDLSNELLLGKQARDRGLFNSDTIRAWMRGESLTYARHGGKLWLLLTLELWLRAFID